MGEKLASREGNCKTSQLAHRRIRVGVKMKSCVEQLVHVTFAASLAH